MSPEAEVYFNLLEEAINNSNAKKVLHYCEQLLPLVDRNDAKTLGMLHESISTAKQILEFENKKNDVVENIISSNQTVTKSGRFKIK